MFYSGFDLNLILSLDGPQGRTLKLSVHTEDSSGGFLAGGKIFIAVAGNIGTGKTTLTKMLSERFGWKPHFEAVTNNPYLEDFYGDMLRWSFNVQIFFLNNRYSAHQAISGGTNSAIQDRSIYEDANIFARNLYEDGKMSDRDYQTYLELYGVMTSQLNPPDLVVYLHKSLPKLKEHIQKRGRAYEANIPDQYLVNLNRYYDEWMDRYDQGKKVIIPSDNLDFLHKPDDFEMICDQIVSSLDQKDLFFQEDIIPGLRAGSWKSNSQSTQV